jgi:hypothetical protein
LRGFRRFPDLQDLTAERLVRKGIDRERRVLADLELADVGLVDPAAHLHFAQVVRDLEQGLGFQCHGDGLAGVDVAPNDDAVNRRANFGASAVDLGLVEGGLLLLDHGFGVREVGLRHGDFGLGDVDRFSLQPDLLLQHAQRRGALVAQRPCMRHFLVGDAGALLQLEEALIIALALGLPCLLDVHLRLLHAQRRPGAGKRSLRSLDRPFLQQRIGFRYLQRRLCLADAGVISLRVEPRDHLALFDRIIEIDQHFGDAPR